MKKKKPEKKREKTHQQPFSFIRFIMSEPTDFNNLMAFISSIPSPAPFHSFRRSAERYWRCVVRVDARSSQRRHCAPRAHQLLLWKRGLCPPSKKDPTRDWRYSTSLIHPCPSNWQRAHPGLFEDHRRWHKFDVRSHLLQNSTWSTRSHSLLDLPNPDHLPQRGWRREEDRRSVSSFPSPWFCRDATGAGFNPVVMFQSYLSNALTPLLSSFISVDKKNETDTSKLLKKINELEIALNQYQQNMEIPEVRSSSPPWHTLGSFPIPSRHQNRCPEVYRAGSSSGYSWTSSGYSDQRYALY